MTFNGEDIKKEFLDNVNYFNEIIMSNKIIFSNRLKDMYDKGREIKSVPAKPRPWMNDKFLIYIFQKTDEIQYTLLVYNDELSFYYIYYKKVYDICSITIIVLSSCITLVEGISLCFEPVIYTNIVILILGTVISIMTSVLKYFNFKNKTEEIIRLKEKVFNCQTKIFLFDKKIKSELFLNVYSDI
jgi:hypothetical protein